MAAARNRKRRKLYWTDFNPAVQFFIVIMILILISWIIKKGQDLGWIPQFGGGAQSLIDNLGAYGAPIGLLVVGLLLLSVAPPLAIVLLIFAGLASAFTIYQQYKIAQLQKPFKVGEGAPEFNAEELEPSTN